MYKSAIIALTALAAVEAASYQKPPKPTPPPKGPETINFPITVNGKKLNTGLVLDNGWFDSKKNITGLESNGHGQTFAAAGVTEIPGGINFALPVARGYLVNEKRNDYYWLNLNNKEISWEVDLSGVGCGFNAAGYTAHMKHGVPIGEGYCDGQNFCNEMDLMEANVGSQAYTPHPCTDLKQESGVSKCDPWGPSDNAYNNHAALYGPGKHIDTTKPFTITTQFAGTGISYVARQWLTQGSHVLRMNDVDDQYAHDHDQFWRNTNASIPIPAPTVCPTCDYNNIEASYKLGAALIFSFWGSGGEGMSWLDGGAKNPNCAYNVTHVGYSVKNVAIVDAKQPPFTNA
ncbi:hypothetical protein HDV00_011476 [Rhizophlyctis rosea]|nr:hypothetical protein HDV00_011476 [Rhizophlyctis rosea]